MARDFVAPGLAATVARRQAFSAVLSANMSWLAKEGGKVGHQCHTSEAEALVCIWTTLCSLAGTP